MAASDVERLVLQVDASIELAKKNLRELSRTVDNEAGNMDRALQRVEKSHDRMGRQLAKTGQFRGGMQQLSFQIGDVSQQMALGVDGSRIFIQQSGQVIQAVQLMAAEQAGWLRFLAGPWGIALLTAGTVLVTFAGRLFENRDAVAALVEKMREQAQQAENNRIADNAWKSSIEGVTDAIRKRREEQEKARQSDVTEERKSLSEASKELKGAFTKPDGINDKIAEAREAERRLSVLRQQLAEGGGGPKGGTTSAEVDAAAARVATLKREIQQLLARALDGIKNVRTAQADILKRQAEGAVDPLRKATDQTARELDILFDKFIEGKIGPAEYRKEVERLTKALKDAQQAATKTGASSGLSGRQISSAEAASIATNAGLQVNSVDRSTERQRQLYADWVAAGKPKDNPVAPPGSSAHEGAKGKWAIDIQITDGVTPQKIRKLYADQGVSLTKVLKERGHLHIEGSRSEAAAAERSTERAVNRRQDQDDAFASAMQSLDAQLLTAQQELVNGVDAQAEFAKRQIDADQRRFELAIQNDVNDGRLREEQGKLLVEKSAAIALQRKANVDLRTHLEKLEELNRTAQQETDFKVEGLRYADEIAKTQAEHRRIQLQIIEALYAQREADLKIALAKAEAAKNWGEHARLTAQMNELPAQRGREEDRARRGTRSPMERWADGIPQSAEEVSEALEEMKVQGIMGAIDSLTALSGGFENMRDVALSAIKQIIAELIRMQLMKLALSIVGGGMGGGMPAPNLGGNLPISALASGSTPLSVSGISMPGFANGGSFDILGRPGIDQNILSINGRAVAKVSHGEKGVIVPRAANVGVPRPANGNAPVHQMRDVNAPISVSINGPVRNPRKTGLQLGRTLSNELGRAVRRGGK